MHSTASGRRAYATTPRRLGLPRLDRARIGAEQAEWLADRTRLMRPEQRLGYSVKALQRTEKKLGRLRPERDACALSLSTHEGVRAMATVIGVSSSLYRRWRREIPAAEIARVPDAAVRIADLAREVAVLEERRRLLIAMRDATVPMLVEDWGTCQLARMVGRDRTGIWRARKLSAEAA